MPISTHTLTWSVTSLLGVAVGVIRISTHTLTWSVTGSTSVRSVPKGISTHTLTWSVTIPDEVKQKVDSDFNSHAHVERDPDIDI